MNSSAPTPSDPNLIQLREIEQDLRAGNLAAASAGLRALTSRSPLDGRAQLLAARLARAQNQPAAEIGALTRALELAPNSSSVRCELAKALSRQGQHDKAAEAIELAVERAPGDMHVLEVGVAIAEAAGQLAAAQRYLEAALQLQPANLAVRKSLARCLTRRSRHAQAEPLWRQILLDLPDDPFALRWLGACLIGLGQRQEAIGILERAFELLPHDAGVQFHLAIARGETPPSAPARMSEELFDTYAARFDAQLVGGLKYRVPKHVADAIVERHPDRNISILDLGCGTGLLGVYLGKIAGDFIGVDVSARMLEQAARHDIYSELRKGDLLAALRAVAPGSFDYVTANDVFVYVGDLAQVIPASFAALRPQGSLIFSCETANDSEGDLVLRPSQRYAHSPASVTALCRNAGFASCTIQPVQLRLEHKVPIAGFIAFARKS